MAFDLIRLLKKDLKNYIKKHWDFVVYIHILLFVIVLIKNIEVNILKKMEQCVVLGISFIYFNMFGLLPRLRVVNFFFVQLL